MENRNIGHEGRNESTTHQHAIAARRLSGDGLQDPSLSRQEVSLLIEFFRLLDRWDRQEVVQ
jgi:hypothetical protein